jgi:thiopurine S-methyltransferase
MQKIFWLERWQLNQIGFHNADINAHLKKNWPSLELPEKSQVFVPFCGKTKDLLWLREQGHTIIAVELSRIAVDAFFVENQLPFNKTQVGEFELFETDGIQIYCGDFFKFPKDILRGVYAVYDRASLVALPSEMRLQYTEKMRTLLPINTQILLVSFFYHQHEMDGPPFSVAQQEVMTLFGEWCNVRQRYSEDVSEKEAHFKAKGLSVIHEEVYSITVENSGK